MRRGPFIIKTLLYECTSRVSCARALKEAGIFRGKKKRNDFSKKISFLRDGNCQRNLFDFNRSIVAWFKEFSNWIILKLFLDCMIVRETIFETYIYIYIYVREYFLFAIVICYSISMKVISFFYCYYLSDALLHAYHYYYYIYCLIYIYIYILKVMLGNKFFIRK